MKLKMLKEKYIPTSVLKGITLEKDKAYEVDSVIVDSYRVKVPMKRAGKFNYVLVGEDEGELLDA